MVKEINIINRLGSKDNDIKFFIKYLPKDDIKTVVEPFAGSFAVIKKFYKDINKYKFHINDNDPLLFYIYQNYQLYLDTLKIVNEEYLKYPKEAKIRKFTENIIPSITSNEQLTKHIIDNKVIRGAIFKITKSNNYSKIEKDILDNAIITNHDYTIIFDKYKYDKEAFLFLDPPYLFSNNSGYYSQNEDADSTKILIDILDYMKVAKCKIMLIINKLNIIEWMFKDYIIDRYLKTYQIGKRKSIHLIIINYDPYLPPPEA